jgi:beta-galactosidase GanA
MPKNPSFPLSHLRPLAIQLGKRRIATSLWYEALRPDPGTRSLGKWDAPHLAGILALTIRRQGKGTVIYAGTYFDDALLAALLTPLKAIPGFASPRPSHAPGLEIVERVGKGKRLWFFINRTGTPMTLSKLPAGKDVLTGRQGGKNHRLAAHGVHILSEAPRKT